MKTITKPWGREEWLELNDKYCYKRIYLNQGTRTSYQYHQFKKETNYIISGKAEVWLENNKGIVEKKRMSTGDYFNVEPLRKHRIVAITDLILQEVSTPEVDDVIRIEDDYLRSDGKIVDEHQSSAVLILTAGTGSSLREFTTHTNKGLLPIQNRAILSHIIEKFPIDYEFVIAVGYKGELVEEYCKLVFPHHNFKFVYVDDYKSTSSGPGHSAFKCKEYLQRPFYISTCDCLIIDEVPSLDGNWLGVYPTTTPDKYSTVLTDVNNNIIKFSNKSVNGYDLAFIGVCSITDYGIFWKLIEERISNGELVSAFESPLEYPSFKVKKLKWIDTGDYDTYIKTKEMYNTSDLSLDKINNEIVYKENDLFIKFIPDTNILENKMKRSLILNNNIPPVCNRNLNFMTYKWAEGETLYEIDDISVFRKFLGFLEKKIHQKEKGKVEYIQKFYKEKTHNRLKLFIEINGNSYFKQPYSINGKNYPSYSSFFNLIDFNKLNSNPFYKYFHGDLQFDNIVFNKCDDTFTYIDWRESFGGFTDSGDIYYDLAKLYGGCVIPYNKMKNLNNIHYTETEFSILYSYTVSNNLLLFKDELENWIIKNNFNLDIVKFIVGLIFLNMAPLHKEPFSKLLWFKSIETLYYERIHK